MTILAPEPTTSLMAGWQPGDVPARHPEPLPAYLVGSFHGFGDLPQRDLDTAELRALASAVAADPSRWEQHVAFADGERHYVSLHRDAHVDVWVLCWTPANDTGWHDHDISSGAVAVVRGTLTEHNLAVGHPSLSTDVPAGQVFSFGPDHIHRLVGKEAVSVSIHAYSPPLWRLGQYSVGSTGVLRRVSVSYADELRPLDDAF
ncbi:MAG: cysteine dioxygenase family protein [Nostocoides sp.]